MTQSDVLLRHPIYEELKFGAYQQVALASELKWTRPLQLDSVLRAIEQSSAVGLSPEGDLVYSEQQKQTTDPVVLVGDVNQTNVSFTLNEYRWGTLFGKNVPRGAKKEFAKRHILPDELGVAESTDPALHTIVLYSKRKILSTPLAITIPFVASTTSMSTSTVHEIVHWDDYIRNRLVTGRRAQNGGTFFKTVTEKRAYGVETAILETQGVSVNALAEKIIKFLGTHASTIPFIEYVCETMVLENVPEEFTVSAVLCLKAHVLTKTFGNKKGEPTAAEVNAFKEVGLINGS